MAHQTDKHARTQIPAGVTRVVNAATGEIKMVNQYRMAEWFSSAIDADDLLYFCDDERKVVAHAINTHDAMQDRIKGLEQERDQLTVKYSQLLDFCEVICAEEEVWNLGDLQDVVQRLHQKMKGKTNVQS